MGRDLKGAGKSGCWRAPRFILLTLLLLGVLTPLGMPTSPALADTAAVVDNHSHLRSRGAPQAPILMTLNQGDQVWVRRREGVWVQVTTPEEVDGWVAAKSLRPAPNRVRPESLPPPLRSGLEDFLHRLRQAVASRQFPPVAALLDPQGVFLRGRFFPDAALDPHRQKPQVVPLWHATDVSLTLGTAWELLITGANPPPVSLSFDAATDTFRVLPPGDQGQVAAKAEREEPLFPAHLQALALDPQAALVPGFPEHLEGVPEPTEFPEDFRRVPFFWVYQVGRDRYRLAPRKGVGLTLVVTSHPGQGFRLRSAFVQMP